MLGKLILKRDTRIFFEVIIPIFFFTIIYMFLFFVIIYKEGLKKAFILYPQGIKEVCILPARWNSCKIFDHDFILEKEKSDVLFYGCTYCYKEKVMIK